MRTLPATRCTLEPLVADHAAEMFVVLSDPAIYEFEDEPPSSITWLDQRYRRWERRGSPDGAEQWLNWVIRLPSGELVGYVQATVLRTGESYVAYVLNSRHWRQGIGSCAVSAMLVELHTVYEVHTFVAVLKAANFRSIGLLRRLNFQPATPEQAAKYQPAADEVVYVASYRLFDNAIPGATGTT